MSKRQLGGLASLAQIWDLGGQQNLRPFWSTYYKKSDAVVVVVDSTDRARISVCKVSTNTLLSNDKCSRQVDGAVAAAPFLACTGLSLTHNCVDQTDCGLGSAHRIQRSVVGRNSSLLINMNRVGLNRTFLF